MRTSKVVLNFSVSNTIFTLPFSKKDKLWYCDNLGVIDVIVVVIQTTESTAKRAAVLILAKNELMLKSEGYLIQTSTRKSL